MLVFIVTQVKKYNIDMVRQIQPTTAAAVRNAKELVSTNVRCFNFPKYS